MINLSCWPSPPCWMGDEVRELPSTFGLTRGAQLKTFFIVQEKFRVQIIRNGLKYIGNSDQALCCFWTMPSANLSPSCRMLPSPKTRVICIFMEAHRSEIKSSALVLGTKKEGGIWDSLHRWTIALRYPSIGSRLAGCNIKLGTITEALACRMSLGNSWKASMSAVKTDKQVYGSIYTILGCSFCTSEL